MRKRGLTMIELLSVCTILIILSAVLSPVFISAKMNGKVAAAKNNLRRLHVALTLYRDDNQGTGYGSAEDMGLPWAINANNQNVAYLDFITKELGDDFSQYSPCGQHPGSVDHDTLNYFPNIPFLWEKESEKYTENTALLADPNCNAHSVDISQQFVSKRSLAVALDGHLISKTDAGHHFWDQLFYQK